MILNALNAECQKRQNILLSATLTEGAVDLLCSSFRGRTWVELRFLLVVLLHSAIQPLDLGKGGEGISLEGDSFHSPVLPAALAVIQ